MFTGLVQAIGLVAGLERRGPGYRLRVGAGLGALAAGESIAVNGACLTVTEHDARGFAADLSPETAARTNLGPLPVGARVNLERALRLGDRLGGHLVSGHVDAVVPIRSVAAAGEARRVTLELPAALAGFLAPKGSVTLDGVSLTVNDVREGEFDVMLVPHTLGATTLAQVSPGRHLNLEVDLLARYVVAYLRSPGGGALPGIEAAPVPASADTAGEVGLAAALRRAGLM